MERGTRNFLLGPGSILGSTCPVGPPSEHRGGPPLLSLPLPPSRSSGRRRAAASPSRHCRASDSASGPPLLPSCTHSAHGGQNELFKAHVLSPQSLLRMPQQLPTAFTQNPKSLRWPGAHVIWPSPTLPPLLCPLPSLATFLPPGPATFLSPGLTTCISSAWVPVPYLFICYLPPSHLPDFNFISFGQALSPSST